MSKYYSITIRIISIITLIAFVSTQVAWGYEGRATSSHSQNSHLRTQQLINQSADTDSGGSASAGGTNTVGPTTENISSQPVTEQGIVSMAPGTDDNAASASGKKPENGTFAKDQPKISPSFTFRVFLKVIEICGAYYEDIKKLKQAISILSEEVLQDVQETLAALFMVTFALAFSSVLVAVPACVKLVFFTSVSFSLPKIIGLVLTYIISYATVVLIHEVGHIIPLIYCGGWSILKEIRLGIIGDVRHSVFSIEYPDDFKFSYNEKVWMFAGGVLTSFIVIIIVSSVILGLNLAKVPATLSAFLLFYILNSLICNIYQLKPEDFSSYFSQLDGSMILKLIVTYLINNLEATRDNKVRSASGIDVSEDGIRDGSAGKAKTVPPTSTDLFPVDSEPPSAGAAAGAVPSVHEVRADAKGDAHIAGTTGVAKIAGHATATNALKAGVVMTVTAVLTAREKAIEKDREIAEHIQQKQLEHSINALALAVYTDAVSRRKAISMLISAGFKPANIDKQQISADLTEEQIKNLVSQAPGYDIILVRVDGKYFLAVPAVKQQSFEPSQETDLYNKIVEACM